MAADPKGSGFRVLDATPYILVLAQRGVTTLHHPNDASLFFLVKPVRSGSLPNCRVQERLVKGLQLLPPSPLHQRSLQPSDVPRPKPQPQSLLLARGHPSDQGSSRNAVHKQVWGRATENCNLQYWDFWKLIFRVCEQGGFLFRLPGWIAVTHYHVTELTQHTKPR